MKNLLTEGRIGYVHAEEIYVNEKFRTIQPRIFRGVALDESVIVSRVHR